MKLLITKRGKFRVLHLFPDTYEEEIAFEDFHSYAKPCTIKFVADAAYTYPHAEIKMEVL